MVLISLHCLIMSISHSKKKDAARSYLQFADWSDQNNLAPQAKQARDQAYAMDPTLREDPSASSGGQSGNSSQNGWKQSLIAEIRATPGDEFKVRQLADIFENEGDHISSIHILVSHFAGTQVGVDRQDIADRFVERAMQLASNLGDLSSTVVEQLTEDSNTYRFVQLGSFNSHPL